MAAPGRTLIVGGGIAGLTLATALHAQGFDIDLIERNSTWQALGAGMAIQPNAMRAFRAFALDGAVADRGMALHHWVFAIDKVNCFARSICKISGTALDHLSE
jgi:2-polyprenyl-6-methoxyphenol hydroxylase-like FAD-dependent oxidoreductase